VTSPHLSEARALDVSEARPLVLVADDDPDIRELVALLLRSQGYEVVQARDGDEALRIARERDPDLLLVDVGMPGVDGFAVCREIQGSGPTAPPVVFLTANAGTDERVTGLDAGASDYIVKPFVARELAARVRAVLRTKARQDDLAAEAARDALTGLLNRRQLDARVDEAVALARRGRPWACVMIDLDGFKDTNDAYGHVVGDRVLTTLAERLRASVRASDVVGRYGGDEFVVLIQTTGDAATVVAHKIWEALTAAPVALEDGEAGLSAAPDGARREIRVGASVGVASWDETMAEAEAFVSAADSAMYAAKRLGGNRIVAAVAD
jgi:diguanylate cyclase (GGDEF)-like protein